MQGIINVIKPAGVTSQQAVSFVKHKFNEKKVGHLGTLDPSGTGVLPICIGKATRLFDYYLLKDKVYRAVFVFGKETDTLDSDGKVVNIASKIPTLEEINQVLPSFVGEINQVPPNYSRKCVNGKRAYELARKDEDFKLQPKLITIYSIKVVSQISGNAFLFEIHCSSGTYVRSIVRDIAYKLNTFGYMGAIIRLKSGNFLIDNAVLLENISPNDVINLEDCLNDFEKVVVNDNLYDKLINGALVKVDLCDKQNVALYCKNQLLGIANIDNGIVKIKTNLR